MNNNMMNYPMPQMFMQNQNNQMMESNHLCVKVKLENKCSIKIPTLTDEKMEKLIEKICSKAIIENKNDYDFLVATEKKVNYETTVEQNGIKKTTILL